jgi:hypothetical protein
LGLCMGTWEWRGARAGTPTSTKFGLLPRGFFDGRHLRRRVGV